MRIGIVLCAAGLGERSGLPYPKQFFEIQGKPLWLWALRPLLELDARVVPVIVLPANQVENARSIVPDETIRLAAGGPTRTASVRSGLALLAGERLDLVLVHDGARPCLESSLLAPLLKEARTFGAATLGVFVRDALKEVHGLTIVRDIPRDGLCVIQTPQAFLPETLHRAHAFAKEKGIEDAPDDAHLVGLLGKEVRVVRGSPFNLKVTYPEDFAFASRYLLA
jgi:2-C-methyl-D-erythritol 4-phosphate cytidylyltransferase